MEASSTVVSITADVPPGASASVTVPLGCDGSSSSGAADSAIIEGGAIVWRAGGGFVPRAGIESATAVQGGAAVQFELTSGAYAFSTGPGVQPPTITTPQPPPSPEPMPRSQFER